MQTAMTITTAEPVQLYGVVTSPEGADGWVHQLFLPEQLRGDVRNGGAVEILEGEFAGTTGEIRRVVESSDFQKLNYYRAEGWTIPLDSIILAHPEPDRLARFHACDQTVDSFIESWRDAAEAMAEIEVDELWKVAGYPSHRAYWVAKGEQAAAAGLQQVSYERVLQLVGAAKTLERLEGAGVNVAPLKTERVVRELRRLPEEQQPAVAAALVAEHQATGRPLTEGLTKKAIAEAEAGLRYDQVAMAFAPWGVFRHFTPSCTKNRKFRFCFEGDRGSSLFQSLQDAVAWFDAKLKNLPQRQTMGCPTCTHCTWLESDVHCDQLGDLIGLTRIWNMPAQCQGWQQGQPERPQVVAAPELALTPVEVLLPPTPQDEIHSRMVASASTRKEPSEHDENNTPQALWEPVLLEWGLDEFTLDPATNKTSTVPAGVKFTKENNALSQSWLIGDGDGVLWMNPPFSMNAEFSEKFLFEWQQGHFAEAIVLEKADTRTAWSQRYMNAASAILRVYGYTKFENDLRENGTATFPIELFYFGSNVDRFAAAYRHLGLVTIPYCFAE